MSIAPNASDGRQKATSQVGVVDWRQDGNVHGRWRARSRRWRASKMTWQAARSASSGGRAETCLGMGSLLGRLCTQISRHFCGTTHDAVSHRSVVVCRCAKPRVRRESGERFYNCVTRRGIMHACVDGEPYAVQAVWLGPARPAAYDVSDGCVSSSSATTGRPSSAISV